MFKWLPKRIEVVSPTKVAAVALVYVDLGQSAVPHVVRAHDIRGHRRPRQGDAQFLVPSLFFKGALVGDLPVQIQHHPRIFLARPVPDAVQPGRCPAGAGGFRRSFLAGLGGVLFPAFPAQGFQMFSEIGRAHV